MIPVVVADAVAALRQLLAPFPHTTRIWVGFSGGVDSTALLWLLSQTVFKERVTALHINHNLQAHSSSWVDHCRNVSAELGFNFHSITVTPASSSEESARNARYQAFESVINEGDQLILGHHIGDQAETLIMRLFRGSGVQGLSGMPVSRAIANGVLLRPLLKFSRTDLVMIVQHAKLPWIDDPTNDQSLYLRNWTRNQLGPLLAQSWPKWESQLGQVADQFEESAKLNHDLALIDAGKCFVNPQVLPQERLPKYRLANLIYAWLRHFNLKPGSKAQIDEIAAQVVGLRSSGRGDWRIDGACIYLYQHQLWIEKEPIKTLEVQSLRLDIGHIEISNGCLAVAGAEYGLPKGLAVTVRGRKAGEKIQRSSGRQSIKKFMNEQNIPPWLRDTWPLIDHEGEIISIVGLWIADHVKVEQGLSLKWLR